MLGFAAARTSMNLTTNGSPTGGVGSFAGWATLARAASRLRSILCNVSTRRSSTLGAVRAGWPPGPSPGASLRRAVAAVRATAAEREASPSITA